MSKPSNKAALQLLKPEDRAQSFSRLDAVAGAKPPMGPTALEVWYRKARSVTLGALDAASVAQALRQGVHPRLVAVRAIELLAADPLAGEQYPGELLASLASAVAVLPQLDAAATGALRDIVAALVGQPRPAALDEATWRELLADAQTLAQALGVGAAGKGAGVAKAVALVHAECDGAPPYDVPLDAPVSIGSAPDATIRFSATTGSGRLARKHALLVADDGGQSARIELFGHEGRLNGEELVERGILRVGDVLELAGVRVSLRRSA